MIGNVILPVLPVFFFDCVLYIFHFNKLVPRASGTEMLVHLLIAVRVRTRAVDTLRRQGEKRRTGA